MSTFVTVGNSREPFTRLVEAVSKLASKLPQPVVLQHGHTPWHGGDACIARPFMDMSEFDKLMEQANVLILHAGAGSVIHAVRAGKVPVVIPRRVENGEIIDNHQVAFARELARTGRVVVAEEPGDLSAAVAEALKRQAAPRNVASEVPLVGLVSEVLRQYADEVNR